MIRGDGQLVDFWRCVAVHLGQALLYQQFGDACAAARRFRASRRAATLGHSHTAAPASFRRARFRHGADEFLGTPHAPGASPAPCAGHGEHAKTEAASRFRRTSSTHRPAAPRPGLSTRMTTGALLSKLGCGKYPTALIWPGGFGEYLLQLYPGPRAPTYTRP